MNLRRVTADDYAGSLRSMILRGEIEPLDELVLDFDCPGCQMCGAPEGDLCDCHDPQAGP